MIPPGLDPTKLPNGSISSFFRGHKIRWDKYAAWWYFDESNKMIPTIAEYDARIGRWSLCYDLSAPIPCKKCGHIPTVDGHDGCLGTLPGVKYACCGHGIQDSYVLWQDGITNRFPSWNKNEE